MDAASFSVGIDWKYELKYLVKARYKDSKSEVLNYRYLSHHAYNNIIIKAHEYYQTATAKSMTNRGGQNWGGQPVEISHLICVIMY